MQTIEMTWNDAVEIMAGSRTNEHRGEAIATIANTLNTVFADMDLCDWIASGTWNGRETVAQIQAELNQVEAQERNDDETR